MDSLHISCYCLVLLPPLLDVYAAFCAQMLRDVVVVIKDSCVPAGSEGGVVDPDNSCGLNTGARIAELLKAILVATYFAVYILYQHRALRDHKTLPYTKYRMTNLYLRVQV